MRICVKGVRMYRTHPKNAPTLNFVRKKSFFQVCSNCDEFPVSLIPVMFVGRKSFVRVDAICDEFPVSLHMIVPSCFMNMKDTCKD